MTAGASGGTPWATQFGAAVAVIDAGGSVVGWTKAAEQLLGHTATDMAGRSAALLLTSGTTAAELAERVAARARTGKPWTGSLELLRKDGERVETLIQAAPLTGEGRADWIVTATDLSGTAVLPEARTTVAAALISRSPIGLTIWDRDIRCVWLNAAAERQDGILQRLRLGRRMTEVQPGPEGEAITAVMRGVLASGEPVIEREYSWTVPGETEERVLSASYFRLEGIDGEPIGVCNLATDISKSRARQHLLTLSEAGHRIGTTLDVRRTAQELAEVAVPLLADYVTVDLAEWVPLGEEPVPRLASSDAGTPVFRRAGMASIHGGLPGSLWELGEAVFVPPSSPFTDAVLLGRSHYEPVLDTTPGTWLDRDPARSRAVRTAGMHSLIIVPLKARGTILGETSFIRTQNQTPFSRDDLLLVEELVGRASLSLDNARRYTRERAASLALQRHLLPQRLSGGDAVDVAFRYLPADTHEGVGGDWFDVFPLPGRRVGLVIGDVVGHGINAAARMGQFRTVVRTLADLDLPPDVLLSRLDRLVARLIDQDGAAAGFNAPVMGGTCVYAVYDPAGGMCTMACAGHPPPALIHPDGSVTFPKLPPGTPLGMGMDTHESRTLELAEGTVIALYTDGLIETRGADLDAGLRRLGATLERTPTASLEELCTRVVAAMTPDERHRAAPGESPTAPRATDDDIALLVARTRVPDGRA
ncbi:SpoIIE family protein phosphatase [Streptomyces sp. NBC_01476]|uniref:SpoIIE family protein phosphatase n=1 Tax=Streptomyces sp. NBC_01476 TaxID=2903881 RepID=UPI002E30BFD7|nr:SpoIIE family protein phosphatase [Streptomyces sp. NBC_01476]